MNLMIHEFGRYVHDEARNAAFAAAIREEVRPGDVVVDLGAGFGLLAMLAARAGAARVYALEQQPYIEVARALAADNGLADRIEFVRTNSLDFQLQQPADVVVAEILGPLGLEEFAVEYLADARRLLRPTGRMVPRELTLQAAPASLPRLRAHRQREFGDAWGSVLGLDLRRLRQIVFENESLPYAAHVFGGGDTLLGAPVPMYAAKLGETLSSRFEIDVCLGVERPGLLDGILAWFDARLSASVALSTGPHAPATHWNQVVFPIAPSRRVQPGDVLRFRIGFHSGGRWSFVPTALPSPLASP